MWKKPTGSTTSPSGTTPSGTTPSDFQE